MKTLVIAEKPSVGRDIARVLGCKSGKGGSLEGDRYVVTWAMGHLVTLADPEGYDEKYSKWDLMQLPIMPDKLKLVVIKQTAKQFNLVKSLINRNDIGDIVVATDAGREGELVARWILIKVGSKKKIKRLWVSSVTDKAIRNGFKNLRDGREYDNLFRSAQARAEADWLVGINGTRALTAKFNAQLSCGRVQTPTLAIIAKREEEIRKFVPKEQYAMDFISNGIRFTWINGKGGNITFDKELINSVYERVKNKKGNVVSVEKSHKKEYSPKLYDLTELQRDANKRFGMSAKETLSVMQRLYEYHKVLTYPRTDSRYLTDDIVETIPERLKALPKEYFKMKQPVLQGRIQVNSNFVDNSRVSDHHAIIPTEQPVFFDDFSSSERKIYDLVVKRFLSVLYPPFEYDRTIIKIDVNGEMFIARGKEVTQKGFKGIWEKIEDDEEINENSVREQELPSVRKGEEFAVEKLNIKTSFTKPPARFNEATLLSVMENPSAYMNTSDRSLSKTLGETGGLGTVATRADIIEKLFSSFLIEKRNKDIFITQKGLQLLKLVPKELKSPEMTARWEQQLDGISKGKISEKEFLSDIRKYTKAIISEIKSSEEVFRHDNVTSTKCPMCGKNMLSVNGKKGKMLVCQDRECGYRKTVSVLTNSRCPVCHKKLELVGEGDGKKFVCVCGHSEKYENFKERKKKESNKMTKREVNAYINKQNKENMSNNPFAELFENFDFK